MDAGVRNLLVVSGADDYIPLFARHRIITMDSMAQLTDADLKQVSAVISSVMLGAIMMHCEGSSCKQAFMGAHVLWPESLFVLTLYLYYGQSHSLY